MLLGETEASPAFGALRVTCRGTQPPWGSAITEGGRRLGHTRDSNAQGQDLVGGLTPGHCGCSVPCPRPHHVALNRSGQSLWGSCTPCTSQGTAKAIQTLLPASHVQEENNGMEMNRCPGAHGVMRALGIELKISI